MSSLHVYKFGSSVLRERADLARAVHAVYARRREGARVLCVVSAIGDTTDRLLREADEWRANGDESALAALLSTGEAEATAMLALALNRAGVPAKRFDASAIGLACEGPRLDARPIAVDRSRLARALDDVGVVVVPGFHGVDEDGETALFGRGGSDQSALFLAERLGADRCVLWKDVDGLYERDPASPGPRPRRFAALSYERALSLGGGVVQPQGIRFARDRGLAFEVGALGGPPPTIVRAGADEVGESRRSAPPPLRVAIAGLGTVGEGLRRLLAAEPERFDVVGVLVRDADDGARHDLRTRDGAPLCVTSADEWFARDPDVVVEAIGGVADAEAIVRRALEAGLDVATANKALLARRGPALFALAATTGVRLVHAAAVAGSVPALELVARRARDGRVRGFDGVLNGTTNAVLDALASGTSFADAVAAAQRAGFAEADPTLDLDGTDAAHKTELLARAAFPGAPPVVWRVRDGVSADDAVRVRADRERGVVTRLVASCAIEDGTPRAELRLVGLAPSHPLARVRGEDNAVLVHDTGGASTHVTGKGAGRWPTAEALFADVADLADPVALAANRPRPAAV